MQSLKAVRHILVSNFESERRVKCSNPGVNVDGPTQGVTGADDGSAAAAPIEDPGCSGAS